MLSTSLLGVALAQKPPWKLGGPQGSPSDDVGWELWFASPALGQLNTCFAWSFKDQWHKEGAEGQEALRPGECWQGCGPRAVPKASLAATPIGPGQAQHARSSGAGGLMQPFQHAVWGEG